jgi:hypothetical protein
VELPARIDSVLRRVDELVNLAHLVRFDVTYQIEDLPTVLPR